MWVDRAGHETPAVPQMDYYDEPRISPDVHEVLTVERSVKSRVSFGGTAPGNVRREARKWLKILAKAQSSANR